VREQGGVCVVAAHLAADDVLLATIDGGC